jgi:hypothetical protein
MDLKPHVDAQTDMQPQASALWTIVYVAAGVVAVYDGIRDGASAVTRRVRSFVKRVRSLPEADRVDDPPHPFLPYGGSVRPFKDSSPRSEARRTASN